MADRVRPAYYNEIDPFAAAWLRELIANGLIAPGDVDERSIVDVQPTDLVGYAQCHFFAGIGVWSHALRRAGWPDDRAVWTGSCPCQPFSSAGKGLGTDDERHLWPEFARLIRECRPPVVLGEQVASAAGRAWLDAVHADLEALDYACGSADLCAAGVGAPHIRQRLYWVADAGSVGRAPGGIRDAGASPQGWEARRPDAGLRVAHGLADAGRRGRGEAEREVRGRESHAPRGGETRGPSAGHGVGGAADWLLCQDGKWRAVEPGTFPLAHGAPARVGRLRGYGNAIHADVAAEFVAAYVEACSVAEPAA